jgi:hypothetical protein
MAPSAAPRARTSSAAATSPMASGPALLAGSARAGAHPARRLWRRCVCQRSGNQVVRKMATVRVNATRGRRLGQSAELGGIDHRGCGWTQPSTRAFNGSPHWSVSASRAIGAPGGSLGPDVSRTDRPLSQTHSSSHADRGSARDHRGRGARRRRSEQKVGAAARGAWRETAATPRADLPRIIGRRASGSLSRSDVRFGRGHAKKLGLDDN